MFAVPPPYITELKSVLLPSPVYCEGVHCACSSCRNTIIRTEFPMEFYDQDSYCSDDCLEESIQDSIDEYNEDFYNAYVDYVLDCDYDW